MSDYPIARNCDPKYVKLIHIFNKSNAAADTAPGTPDTSFGTFRARINLGFVAKTCKVREIILSNIMPAIPSTSDTEQNPNDSFILYSNIVEDGILAILPPLTASPVQDNAIKYSPGGAKFYLRDFHDGQSYDFQLLRATDMKQVVGRGIITSAGTPLNAASSISILIEFSNTDIAL